MRHVVEGRSQHRRQATPSILKRPHTLRVGTPFRKVKKDKHLQLVGQVRDFRVDETVLKVQTVETALQ